MYKIIVGSLYGIKTGMRLTSHRDNTKNGNIIRQNFIQSEKQVEIPFLFNIRMKKELAGMYPGIRPSAAKNSHRCFKQFAQSLFQNLLHTYYPRMFLPAAVPGAVIGYVEEISQCIVLWIN